MRAVRAKDTKPEMVVRRITHALGFRYRLHARDLPGRPDLVFRSRRKVIFVHGCFWHGHKGCPRAAQPRTNQDFWRRKLERNAQRDAAQLASLESEGWTALVIWQCETKRTEALERRLRAFLSHNPFG
jgi:DNA mismatch endonuclease Vsr